MNKWVEWLVDAFYDCKDNSPEDWYLNLPPFGKWMLKHTGDDDSKDQGVWFTWYPAPQVISRGPWLPVDRIPPSKTYLYVDIDDERELRKQLLVWVEEVWSVFTVEERLDAVHG